MVLFFFFSAPSPPYFTNFYLVTEISGEEDFQELRVFNGLYDMFRTYAH